MGREEVGAKKRRDDLVVLKTKNKMFIEGYLKDDELVCLNYSKKNVKLLKLITSCLSYQTLISLIIRIIVKFMVFYTLIVYM